jgi:hypothetical protein
MVNAEKASARTPDGTAPVDEMNFANVARINRSRSPARKAHFRQPYQPPATVQPRRRNFSLAFIPKIGNDAAISSS